MKALLLHVRISPARYAAPPLTVAGLLILLNRDRYWVGIWPETGAAITIAAFFLSFLVAGLSAWATARAASSGLREQASTAVPGRRRVEAARFASHVGWSLIPYAAVAAVAALLTSRATDAPGLTVFAEYLVIGGLLLLAACAWGWLVGGLLDPVIAILASALSWFLVVSIFGDLTDAAPVSGPPWVAVEAEALALRTAALLLLAFAVCSLPIRDGRSSSRSPALLGIAATLALVSVAYLITPVLTPRPAVASPTCVSGTIRYCLWPEHEKYLPLIASVDGEIANIPVDIALPDTIVDYALSGSRRYIDGIETELPGDFAPEFDISEGSRWALARGVATAITVETLQACDSPAAFEDPEYRWEQLRAWFETRLAGGGTPDYTTNAPGDIQSAWAAGRAAADSMDDGQQATWAKNLIDGYRADYCEG